MDETRYPWDQLNDPVLDLVEEPLTAYVLAGLIIPGELRESPESVWLATTTQDSIEFPVEFAPVLGYFHNMRAENQAREWMREAGAPSEALDNMVDSGQLLRVSSSQDGKNLELPVNSRLEPLSVISNESSPPQIWATPFRALNEEIYPIGEFLAAVLYSETPNETLLQALARAAQEFDLPMALASRALATELPRLIAGDYMYFTRVD